MDCKETCHTNLKEAFIENITSASILKQILVKDTLSQLLFSLPPLQYCVAEFKEQLNIKVQSLIEYAIYTQYDRQKELDGFSAFLEDLIEEKCIEGKKYIGKFMNIKMKIVDTISNLDYEDPVCRIKLDNAVEDYIHQVDCLWEVLMKIETELLSKIEEMTYRFRCIMKKKIMDFLEYTHLIIEELQNLDKNLFDKLYEFCTKEISSTDPKTNAALPQLFKNEHSANVALSESHRKHLDVFVNQEKLLTSRATAWLADLVNRLNQKELQRNRHRVMEINRFLDLQRDCLDNLGTSVTIKLLNNA